MKKVIGEQYGSAPASASLRAGARRGVWLLCALLGSACAEPESISVSRSALQFSDEQATSVDQTELPFTLASLPGPGLEAYLTFRARIESGVYRGGSAPLLLVWLNPAGNTFDPLGGLDAARLVNKPLEMKTRRGERYPYCSGGTWRLLYSSNMIDGSDAGAQNYDSVVNGDPYEFRLRVTDLLQVGNNLLAFQANPRVTSDNLTVVIKDISIDYLDPSQNVPVEATPPWGGPSGYPMYVYEPGSDGPVPYTVAVRDGGGIDVTVGGQTYPFESEWTFPAMITPGGQAYNRFVSADVPFGGNEPGFTVAVTHPTTDTWEVAAAGARYTIHRLVKAEDDHIDVTDTITDLADEGTIGVRLQHNTPLVGTGEGGTVYLAGSRLHWTPLFSASTQEYPENPTVYYSASGAGSIGLIARSDAFRAHARLFVDRPGFQFVPHFGDTPRVGIEDAHAGISDIHGGVHVNRWSIFPIASDDYWQFVNRARRALNVNFTIPGGFSFVSVDPITYSMSGSAKSAFVADRGLQMVSTALGQHWPTDTWECGGSCGSYAHGLDFPTLLNDNPGLDSATGFQGNWIEAAAAVLDGFAAPPAGAKKLVYFHSYLSALPGGLPIPSLYDDSRIRDDSLDPVAYEQTSYQLLNPSAYAYSVAMEENLDIIRNDMDADGVYWDEMDHSFARVTYGVEEGYTVDTAQVDQQVGGQHLSGFDVTDVYSTVTLLTLPWRVQTAQALLAAGKTIVANGAPETETMASVHFPRFVETNGGASLLRKTHLFTPIALGDYIWDINDAAVARQIWERLEEGGLYYHYRANSALSYPKITSYMFPFTPLEIRPGVLIGEERILLSRSGIASWGDGLLPSAVHVFDEEGVEVADPMLYVTYVNQHASVELPYGYTAALIR